MFCKYLSKFAVTSGELSHLLEKLVVITRSEQELNTIYKELPTAAVGGLVRVIKNVLEK